MIIQDTDLFKDLSPEAMTDIGRITVSEPHEQGTIIYTQKDQANDFYILIEGGVRLAIGKEGLIDYTVSRPGEVFGWSSMLDRGHYTAEAHCQAPSKVARIPKAGLNEVFEKHPKDGVIFFKRLAGAVLQRLVDNYNAFISEGSLKGVTYGTGQVVVGYEE